MTEQDRHNIKEQLLTSSENLLTTGTFSFDEQDDHRIEFSLVKPRKDRPSQDYVVITVSYPFDRERYEDVNESLTIPSAEFDRIVQAIVGGDNYASFSDGRTHFELLREESGRIRFKFANEGFELHAPCVIDRLSL